MPSFTTNDGFDIYYQDVGAYDAEPLILIHGFTGSSEVFLRNIPLLAIVYRVIAPDLRGHGKSDKSHAGHHVARLAMDLRNLIDHLQLPQSGIRVIGGSLGCAVIWSYAELFTASAFSHVVFVDQSPLQNYTSNGDWGIEHGNRSCNSAAALAHIQATLTYRPEDVYMGTIHSCLACFSHPRSSDTISESDKQQDVNFFLEIAKQGDGAWFGKLMADHTSLDWRTSIQNTFGNHSASNAWVLVVASSRSGCFPPEGPLHVLELVNAKEDDSRSVEERGTAQKRGSGIVIDWGGHWCYWENPNEFNELMVEFLQQPILPQLQPLSKEDRSGLRVEMNNGKSTKERTIQ